MEYHIVLERLCPCMERHKVDRIRSFNTREEAEEHAYEWADTLNTLCCGRHGFDNVEVDDNFVITVENGGFVEACEI